MDIDREREDFEAGEDVTKYAAAKDKRSTVVLSVRVSVDELRRLEVMSTRTGKKVSQLAREAIASFVVQDSPRQTWQIMAGNVIVTTGTRTGTSARYLDQAFTSMDDKLRPVAG